MTLVSSAAREAGAPMPFLSTLVDRYTSAKARGRGDFDWSAIGLSIAEDAGMFSCHAAIVILNCLVDYVVWVAGLM